jgi:hypothetical protein
MNTWTENAAAMGELFAVNCKNSIHHLLQLSAVKALLNAIVVTHSNPKLPGIFAWS